MSLEAICDLSEQDWEHVKKLSRVGYVRVLSSQVSIHFGRSDQSIGGAEGNRLSFPSNWSLEWVGILPSKYEDKHMVSMTWKVEKIQKAASSSPV